ncbi:MAG TPA: phosphoglucosamine mutase [Solirubrobacteraceae bacterium]|nr:phosphoglucosamine mutase [Solirubrobacteraceae bacterium]
MARKLFGTDGVRGVAGELLSAELALALARAATHGAGVRRAQVLIVRDTRESGEMLQAAVAAGVSAAGGDALLGGVLPTPAAPLLIARYGLHLGVVISASHNPYRDNGIKFFGADGYKLSDELELAIERELEAGGALGPGAEDAAGVPGGKLGVAGGAARTGEIGRVRELRGAGEDYLRELHTRFRELRLEGVRVLLDCANGATYQIAPEIFRRLGASVTVIGDAPDGRNINAGCGSTHVHELAARMRAGEHDVGFAFDGDGDRVLAVDRLGEVVDGDELIALAALHLRERGLLRGGGVAVTVMTNYGFHAAMEREGVAVATTQVGDRQVLEELRARGWTFGGEQSGHIIELGFNHTGDGIASALLTLEALGGGDLSRRDAMAKLPQRLVNVDVRDRDALAHARAVQEGVSAVERELAGRGRVLVRASGTEPLVRVMVEAPSEREAGELCERLAALIERELGREAAQAQRAARQGR